MSFLGSNVSIISNRTIVEKEKIANKKKIFHFCLKYEAYTNKYGLQSTLNKINSTYML